MIHWTEEAIESYNAVVVYLSENWSEKVVDGFIEKVSNKLKVLETDKVKFRQSAKRNIHEVLITKHNLLIYRVYEDRIDLITFWDTRQNQRRKKFL